MFGLKSCPFFVRDGKLYERLSKRVVDEIELFLKQQPVEWFSFSSTSAVQSRGLSG